MAENRLISQSYKELLLEYHDLNPLWGNTGQKVAGYVLRLVQRYGCQSVLDYGCGTGSLKQVIMEAEGCPISIFDEYDPGIPEKDTLPIKSYDLVTCIDVLEHVEPDCLESVLSHIYGLTSQAALCVIALQPAEVILQDDRNAHLCLLSEKEWFAQFQPYDWDVQVIQWTERHLWILCIKKKENRKMPLRELIRELRNRRDIDDNFPIFHSIVEERGFFLLETWDLRWLVSICDTYADYGNEIERRNALLVSLFVNLIRISDTYLLTQDCTEKSEMVALLSQDQIPLSDGLMTLNLAKQDTCLNLAKRLDSVLEETPFFHAVYRKAVEVFLKESALLSGFSSLTEQPERMFPENARELPDNYGVI